MLNFFALRWTLKKKINLIPSALLTLLQLRSEEHSAQLRQHVVLPPFYWDPDLRIRQRHVFTEQRWTWAKLVKWSAVTLRHGGTCARHLSELHAEDEAGLVSFSFSLLQHVHRETAALDAMLVQDLDGRLAGRGPLWLLIIQAVCLEWEKCTVTFARTAGTKTLRAENKCRLDLNSSMWMKPWLFCFSLYRRDFSDEQAGRKLFIHY